MSNKADQEDYIRGTISLILTRITSQLSTSEKVFELWQDHQLVVSLRGVAQNTDRVDPHKQARQLVALILCRINHDQVQSVAFDFGANQVMKKFLEANGLEGSDLVEELRMGNASSGSIKRAAQLMLTNTSRGATDTVAASAATLPSEQAAASAAS